MHFELDWASHHQLKSVPPPFWFLKRYFSGIQGQESSSIAWHIPYYRIANAWLAKLTEGFGTRKSPNDSWRFSRRAAMMHLKVPEYTCDTGRLGQRRWNLWCEMGEDRGPIKLLRIRRVGSLLDLWREYSSDLWPANKAWSSWTMQMAWLVAEARGMEHPWNISQLFELGASSIFNSSLRHDVLGRERKRQLLPTLLYLSMCWSCTMLKDDWKYFSFANNFK